MNELLFLLTNLQFWDIWMGEPTTIDKFCPIVAAFVARHLICFLISNSFKAFRDTIHYQLCVENWLWEGSKRKEVGNSQAYALTHRVKAHRNVGARQKMVSEATIICQRSIKNKIEQSKGVLPTCCEHGFPPGGNATGKWRARCGGTIFFFFKTVFNQCAVTHLFLSLIAYQT